MTAAVPLARRGRVPLGGALLASLGLGLAAAPAGDVLVGLAVGTARLTAGMLNLLGLPVARTATTLHHPGGFACEIDLACTALVPAVLLAMVLAAGRARLPALALGVLCMAAVNQLRLVGLVWIGVHAPERFDVMHALAGPLLLLVAGLGYLFGWRRARRR